MPSSSAPEPTPGAGRSRYLCDWQNPNVKPSDYRLYSPTVSDDGKQWIYAGPSFSSAKVTEWEDRTITSDGDGSLDVCTQDILWLAVMDENDPSIRGWSPFHYIDSEPTPPIAPTQIPQPIQTPILPTLQSSSVTTGQPGPGDGHAPDVNFLDKLKGFLGLQVQVQAADKTLNRLSKPLCARRLYIFCCYKETRCMCMDRAWTGKCISMGRSGIQFKLCKNHGYNGKSRACIR